MSHYLHPAWFFVAFEECTNEQNTNCAPVIMPYTLLH